MKSCISNDAFTTGFELLESKIIIIQSHKNLSIYHPLDFIISIIPSKYTFNSNNTLSGGIFSLIVVNHIISKNIICRLFFIANPNQILSVHFIHISFKNIFGINFKKTSFKSL